MKIVLDGEKLNIQEADRDRDGVIGEYETIIKRLPSTVSVVPKEENEIQGLLRELNSDDLDPFTRMSGIDQKTRLTPLQIGLMSIVDSLVLFKALPSNCINITRQLKRLSVSKDGLGRKEMVEASIGRHVFKKESTGFFNNIKNKFKGDKEDGSNN